MNRALQWLASSRGLVPPILRAGRHPRISKGITSNLPHRSHRRLVGRKEEVRSLLHEFRRGAPFVLLYGPAGSGKTSLALEVAQKLVRLRARGPLTAVVWLPARPAIHTADGFLQSPLACGNLESFITNICAAIGRQDILKELPEKQPPLLHAALAEKAVLLLPDDLDEVDDSRVIPFLTSLPDHTSIFATSRNELNVPRRFRVSPLGQKDSAKLIEDLLDNNGPKSAETAWDSSHRVSLTRDEAQKLYQITGGVPLALVWATSLVRVGSNLDQIVATFEDSTSDILKFCFYNAWRQIEKLPASNILGALALFTSGVEVELLSDASGMGRSSPEFSRGIVMLRRLGLTETLADRLVLLPMTRSFVMDSVFGSPPDPRSEELRMQWADALSRYVGASLLVGEIAECFERLEAERSNLEELLTWASSQSNPQVQARAAVVYRDVSYYLFSRGYWRTLMEHSDWAVESLWKQGLHEEAIGVLLTWVARVYLLRGEQIPLQACFTRAERLISLLASDETPLPQAILDFNLASLRQREGDDPRGAELLRGAAAVFERDGRAEWLARTSNRLGNVLSAQGKYQEARNAYEAAISAGAAVEETAQGREVVAIARGNRGILANRQGDSAKAIEFLREAEPLIIQTMDGATLLMELAIAEYRSGRERRAYRLGATAQEKARELRVGVTLAESDLSWERDVLPQLAHRYGWVR